MLSVLSLAVVGAQYPNPGKMPARRFEIALCRPCDPVELRPEPRNLHDPRAVAVYSERGVQLGYLSAERCGLICRQIEAGRRIEAVFQVATPFGAIIRVAFDGAAPILPAGRAIAAERYGDRSSNEPEFYPDYEPCYD